MFKYVRKLFIYLLMKDKDLLFGYKSNIKFLIYDNRQKSGRLNINDCDKISDLIINRIFED